MTSRLPRFQRAPERATTFRLTERDLEILRQVRRHRLLSSRQLTRLLGSPQPLLRRLHLLFHHGYLDRPKAQLDYFHRLGSRPFVYGLTPKGGRVLEPEGRPVTRHDHLNLTRRHLEHTLLVAEVMVTLELAVRVREDVRLERVEEPDPRWSVTVEHGGASRRVGLVPDQVVVLEQAGQRIVVCLEADRGTMPVTRASLAWSSVWRKLLAYVAVWTAGRHRQFGASRLRVLTVAGSATRLDALRTVCERLDRGHGLFVVTDLAGLDLDALL
jgi:DNA-binding Lrp family transcriptional regulator